MSIKILISALVVIGLLTVSAVFYFQKPDLTSTAPASPGANATPPQSIKIQVLKGAVEIFKANQEKKTITTDFTSPLNEIEKITTQRNSLALIILPDKTSLKLDEDSEIGRPELGEPKTVMDLIKGRILVRIYKILDKGESFEVKTSNLVAAVRGTIFSVAFKQNKSEIVVLQKKVEVVALDPQTKKPIPDVAPITLQSLEKTVVEIEKPPTKEKPIEVLKVSAQELEQFKKEELFQSETVPNKTIFEENNIEPVSQKIIEQKPSSEKEELIPLEIKPPIKSVIEKELNKPAPAIDKITPEVQNKPSGTSALLEKRLIDFEISPSQPDKMKPDAKIQFKALGIYNDGSKEILTSALLAVNGVEIIWHIEGAPGIGQIDETGYFIAGPYGGKGEIIADFTVQEIFLKSKRVVVEVEAPAAPADYQGEPRG